MQPSASTLYSDYSGFNIRIEHNVTERPETQTIQLTE